MNWEGTAIAHSYFPFCAAGILSFQDASVLSITDVYLSASTISSNPSVNNMKQQQQIYKNNSDKKKIGFLLNSTS